MQTEVKKAYVVSTPSQKEGIVYWDIVLDEQEARAIDPNFRLATLDDLREFAKAAEPIEGFIEVVEGVVQWQEYILDEEEESYFEDYVLLEGSELPQEKRMFA